MLFGLTPELTQKGGVRSQTPLRPGLFVSFRQTWPFSQLQLSRPLLWAACRGTEALARLRPSACVCRGRLGAC